MNFSYQQILKGAKSYQEVLMQQKGKVELLITCPMRIKLGTLIIVQYDLPGQRSIQYNFFYSNNELYEPQDKKAKLNLHCLNQ